MNPDPVIMIPTLEQLEQGGFATIRTTLTCTGCNHIINSPVVVRDALHCIEQLFHANKIRLQGNAPEIWMKPNSNKCPNCMRNYMKPSIPNDITYIDWLSLFCLKPIRPCNREQLELFAGRADCHRECPKQGWYTRFTDTLQSRGILDDGLGYL